MAAETQAKMNIKWKFLMNLDVVCLIENIYKAWFSDNE